MKRRALVVFPALAAAATISVATFTPQPEQPKIAPQPPKAMRAVVHAEVVEPTPTPTPTPSPTPTATVTWQDNPNGCDEQRQWIAAEAPYDCIDKVQPTSPPTPTPTKASSPASAPSDGTDQSSVKAIITKWANHYGVDPAWLIRVAMCESGLNPAAINLHYSDGGNPTGLFQFVPPTFYANAARAAIANPYIWNVEHQAQTAAYMFSIGQSGQWECK